MADITDLWGDIVDPENIRAIGASLGKQAEAGKEPSISASLGAGIDVAQAQFQRTGERLAQAAGAEQLATQLGVAAEQNIAQAAPNLYQPMYEDTGLTGALNLTDPNFWKQSIPNMLGTSAPFFAGAGAGAVAGAALGPVGSAVGAIIGGTLGGGLTSFIQNYGDNYYSYIENNPGDFEGADDYAAKASGLGAAIDAASVAIAPIGPAVTGVSTALKKTALQTLLQGAAEGGNQYAQNLMQRRYLDSGIDPTTGVATAAVGGGLLEAVVLPAEIAAARRIGAGPQPSQAVTPSVTETQEAPPPPPPAPQPPAFATQRLAELDAIAEPTLEQSIERAFLRESVADPTKFEAISDAYALRDVDGVAVPTFKRAEEIQPSAIAESVVESIKDTTNARDVLSLLSQDVGKVMSGEYRDSTAVKIADVYRQRITPEERTQIEAERSALKDRLEAVNERLTTRRMQLERTAPSQKKQIKTLNNLMKSDEQAMQDGLTRLAAIEYLFPEFPTQVTPETAGIVARFPQSAISAGIQPVQQPFFGQAPQTTLERVMSQYGRAPVAQRATVSGEVIQPPTRDLTGVAPPTTDLTRPSLGVGAGSPVTQPAENRLEAVARSATNVIPQEPVVRQPRSRLEAMVQSARTPESFMRRPEPIAEPVVEPVAEPAVQAAAEPVVQAAAEPAIQPATQPAAQPAAQPRRGRRRRAEAAGRMPNAQARRELEAMIDAATEGPVKDSLQTALNALAAADLRALERQPRRAAQPRAEAAAQPAAEAVAQPAAEPAQRSVNEGNPPPFGVAVGNTTALLDSPTVASIQYGTGADFAAGPNTVSAVTEADVKDEVNAAIADLVDNLGMPANLVDGIQFYKNSTEEGANGIFFKERGILSLSEFFFDPANFSLPNFRELLRFTIAHELGHNLHHINGYETRPETRISYQTVTVDNGSIVAVSAAAPPMIREIFGLLDNEMRTVIVPNATRLVEGGMEPDQALAQAARESGVAGQFTYPFFYVGERQFNGPYGKDWTKIQSEIIAQIFAIHMVNPQWLEQNAPLASAFIKKEIANNESGAARREVPQRVREEVRPLGPGLAAPQPTPRGRIRGEEVARQERAEPAMGRGGEVRADEGGQRSTVLGGVRDVAPTFYSAAKSAIESLKMNKAPGQQWLNTLRNIPGVKQEELEYYDLPNWLSSQTGSITKQQVLDEIEQRQIDVVDAYGGGKYEAYTFPSGTGYKELLLTLPNLKGKPFINKAHDFGDVKNILAHVRMKERVDVDGNRVLNIEEVQSDWHQTGRREGYTEESGIPDAPFKTTWPDLALRRIVRFAAENGYDRIAWTTGPQQKYRYDIRRSFSEVLYKKNTDGTYHIRPVDKGGNVVGEVRSVKEKDLSKNIPKTVAERIVNGEGNKGSGLFRSFNSLSGDMLDAGDGMLAFYDRELVNRAKTLFGKLGGRMTTGKIEVMPEGSSEKDFSTDSVRAAKRGIVDGGEVNAFLDFQLVGSANSAAELDQIISEYDGQPLEFSVQFPESKPEAVDFHVLEIPESLKEIAVYKGFPLFMNQRNSAIANAVNTGSFGSIGHAVDSMQTMVNSALEQARPTSIYNGADETLRDTLTRTFVNSFYRLEQFQKEMAKKIGLSRISDEMDAAGQIERFSGQVTEDERKIQRQYLDPLMKFLFDNKLDYGMLNLFAYARHARERNEEVAGRNAVRYNELRQQLSEKYDGDLSKATLDESKTLERYRRLSENFADAGSGMSTKDASDIMNRFRDEGLFNKYSEAMKFVDDLIKSTQQRMVANGLIEEEVVGTWNDKYKSYVPLTGWAIDEFDSPQNSPMRVGRGFSIGGKESLAALGRKTMAFPPITNAVKQSYEKAIRARKAEVGRRFLNLVRTFQDDTMWEVIDRDNPIYKRYMDSKKDAVLLRRQSTRGPNEDLFEVKENGQTILIDIKDDNLRRAMLNLGAADMGKVVNMVQDTFGRVSSFLAGMTTRWNPAWSVINVPRDFMAGMMNLVAEADLHDGLLKGAGKIDGKSVVQAAMSDYVSLKYHKALSRYLKNEAGNTAEDSFVKEFFEDGGATGYVRNLDSRQLHKELESSIELLGESSMLEGGMSLSKVKRGLNGVKNAIEHFNDMTENAVRVVAYVNARKAGVSRDKAALLAKNVTVNFNRRGEAGPLMNSLYMFWQASINGNLQFFRTMSSAEARKIMYYAAGTAAAITAFSLANSEEEENGKTEWENLPDYVKENSIPVKFPGLPILAIPMPYGYSIITYGAIKATEAMLGIESAGGFAAKVTGKFANDMSPLRVPGDENAASGLVRGFTPTAVRPVVDLALNKDFAGNPIYKENPEFAKVKLPDAALHRRGTTSTAIAFTNMLNKATGGTDFQSGFIDINPDSLEYLIGEVFGGAGRTLMQAYGVGEKVLTGRDIETRQIPIVNKIVKTTSWTMNPGDFYDRVDNVYRVEAEAKTLRGAERGNFVDENAVEYRAIPYAKSAQSQLRKLYEQRKNVQNSSLDDKAREARIEQIELQIQKVYDRFNSQYEKLNDRLG